MKTEKSDSHKHKARAEPTPAALTVPFIENGIICAYFLQRQLSVCTGGWEALRGPEV